MGIKKRWIVLFLCSILGISVLLYASDTRLIDLHVKAGEVDEALRLYESLLVAQPRNPQLHYEIGTMLLQAERTQQAQLYLEQAFVLGFKSERLLNHLYAVYQGEENRDGMIRMLELLLTMRPQDSSRRAQLAALYTWAGQPEDAIVHYSFLLKDDPGNAEYVYKISSLFQAQLKYGKASAVVENYRAYAPEDDRAKHLLADLYLADGHWKKAAALYENILQKNPADRDTRDRLVEIYKWKKNAPQALSHLHYLADLPDRTTKNYRQQFMTISQQYEPLRAVGFLERQLQSEPENSEIHGELAELFVFLGRPRSALFHLKKQLQFAPHDPSLHKKLADLLQTIDEPEEALVAYRAAFENGDTSRTTINYLLQEYSFYKKFEEFLSLQEQMLEKHIARTLDRKNRAAMFFKTGDVNSAIDGFIEVIQKQPQDTDTRQRLAYALIAADRNTEAAEVLWQGVQKFNLAEENYLQTCIRQFVLENHYDRSLYCYRLLSRNFPENLDYQFGYRNELVRNGLYKEALAEYKKWIQKHSLSIADKLQIAMLYWRLGDKEKMRAFLPRKMNSLPEQKQLVQFYFESAMFDEALKAANPLLQTMPGDSALLRILGLSYAWNNRPETAIKILEKYHRDYRGDYESRFHLAEIFHAIRKKRKAQEEFTIALRMLRSEAQNKNSQLVAARIYARQNKLEESRKIYENLLQGSPEDLFVELDYVATLIDASLFAEATTRLNAFRGKHPMNSQAIQLQSALYYKNGKPRQALQAMQLLEKNGSLNSGQMLDMADLHLLVGDWVAARNKLESALKIDPKNEAARARLFRLRRDYGTEIATVYSTEQQSSRFQRRMYSALLTFAKSSLGQFIFRADHVMPSDATDSGPQPDYDRFSVTARSRLNDQWQAQASTALNRQSAVQDVTSSAVTSWFYRPGDALKLRLFYNQIWREIVFAETLGGRQRGVHFSGGLHPIPRLHLQTGFAHSTNILAMPDIAMGTLNQFNVQSDYQFQSLENMLLSYNFYRYDYSGVNNSHELSQFLNDDDVHNIGVRFNYDTNGFYINLGGSLGYQMNRNEMSYFTDVNLEYMLLRNLRLRSEMSYGTENRTYVQGDSYKFLLDLGYFY